MHTFAGLNFWDQAEAVYRPEYRRVKKHTTAELRAMVKDRQKAAWIGIALTVLVQTILLSAWVGGLGQRVDANGKDLERLASESKAQFDKLGSEQKSQGALVYGMPYLQQSVSEIKGDVKELKQLVVQGIRENQQKEIRP